MFDFAVLSIDEDLADVKEDLAEVQCWFALGVLLNVNCSGLERLRVRRKYSHDGLEEVIRLWLRSGTARWILLAEALERLGYRSSASRLTANKGEYHCVPTCMFVVTERFACRNFSKGGTRARKCSGSESVNVMIHYPVVSHCVKIIDCELHNKRNDCKL